MCEGNKLFKKLDSLTILFKGVFGRIIMYVSKFIPKYDLCEEP